MSMFNCADFNNVDREMRKLADQFPFCSKGYFWCRDVDQVLDNLDYPDSRVFGLHHTAAIEILDQVYPEVFSDCKNISDKTCKFLYLMNVWTRILSYLFTSDLIRRDVMEHVDGIRLIGESEGNPFVTFTSQHRPTDTCDDSKNEKLITKVVNKLFHYDRLHIHEEGLFWYLSVDKILETEEIEWCGQKVRLLHAAHVYDTMQYTTFRAKQLAVKNGAKLGDSLCSFRERFLLQKQVDMDPQEVYLQFIPIPLEPWMHTIDPRYDTVQHPMIATKPLSIYPMID